MKKWDLKGFCGLILEYTRHFQYRENWSGGGGGGGGWGGGLNA